ncbi:hypothetical protein DL762_000258 [Monosporascus cannonballus]|uniref:Heterokaryon incompatibility domain-containing protein n=1 Tax=Monosporascus cannonballus TaxID=155416 RepID=A0ABY0HJP7_9PEZI|nr:hypothetical protein DL762_000258 [Monosporascus cannonballus]
MAATSHSTYPSQLSIYPSQLPAGYIRLLTILPRAASNSPYLNLELRIVALSPEAGRRPSYLALSYVWGPPDQEKKLVYVNGCPFAVGRNLESALLHLQDKILLPIWIDAICINQVDDSEKSAQVAQMGTVYSSAQETIIWLQEGTPETDNLFSQMEDVGTQAIHAGIWNLEPNDMKIWPNVDFQKSHIRNALQRLMDTIRKGRQFPMTALVDFSYRPWFRRAWIVQELSRPTQYRFMCGHRAVSGDVFIAAFFFCVLWFANELAPLATSGVSKLIGAGKALWRNPPMIGGAFQRIINEQQFMISPRAATTLGTRRKVRYGAGLTLMQALVNAFTLTSDGPLEASVPKDKVYAFLGVARDSQELGIQPDYSDHVTYQHVYTQVAGALIRAGRLDILGLCRVGYLRTEPYSKVARDPALPSWVPDWNRPIVTAWSQCFEDGIYHASRNMPRINAAPTVLITPPLAATLRLKAMFLGTVSQLGSAWTPQWEKEFDYAAAQLLFQEVEQFLSQSVSIRVYTDQQRSEGPWRIPIGDKEVNPLGITARATTRSYNEYLELKHFMASLQQQGKGQVITFLTSIRGLWASYMSNMKDMWDARPCVTGYGHVGLCPLETRVHDEIWLPVGAHVPYIFRKTSTSDWRLVGEAFLYGVMDGELSCIEQDLYELNVV